MADTLSELLVKIGADVDDLEKGMGKADKATKSSFDKMISYANGVSNAMLGIGGALIALGKSLADGAIQDEKFASQLRRTIGDIDKTEKALKKLDDVMKGGIGFSEDELQGSIQALAKFRTDIDKTLDAAMNLAAGTGRSLDDATQIIGLFSIGSTRAMLQLQRGFGITKEEIMKFSKSGKADLEALMDYIQNRFPNAAKEMADTTVGKMQDIKNKIEMLKDTIGQGALTAFEPWIDKINELAGKFNELPDETKKGFGEMVVTSGAIFVAGGMLGKVVTVIGGVITKLKEIPAAAKIAGTGIAGIAGPLGAVALAGTIMGTTVLAAMQKVQTEAWKLKQSLLDERGVARDLQGYLEVAQEKGITTASGRAKFLTERGYKFEDIMKGIGGAQTLRSEVQNVAEWPKLNALKESLRQVAQEMKDTGQATQEDLLTPLQSAEQKTKEIEHNLKMGWIQQTQAAGEYNVVIGKLQEELAGLKKETKEYKEVQDDLFKAQERQKELGWGDVVKGGWKDYYPQLPKGTSGKTDVEGFKQRMGIGTEEESSTAPATSGALSQVTQSAAGASSALDNLKQSANTSSRAMQQQAQASLIRLPNTVKSIADFANVNDYQTLPGFGSVDMSSNTKSAGDVWRDLLAPNVVGAGQSAYSSKSGYAAGKPGQTMAQYATEKKLTAQEVKVTVDLLINGQKTSNYTDGQTAVQAKTTTDQPNYKELAR